MEEHLVSGYQEYPETRQGVVAASVLNVRNGPGTAYPVVKKLSQSTAVKVFGEVQAGGYLWGKLGLHEWAALEYVTWTFDDLDIPDTPDEKWQRAWPIVLNIEGTLSLEPRDPGNWFNGRLIGTKFGISAKQWASQYDIPNLTKAQALAIYFKHYWVAAGCPALAWPLCLIVFDTSVQHGAGVALALLQARPTPEEIYLGQRALRYTNDPNWNVMGIGWGRRIDTLHDIVKDRN